MKCVDFRQATEQFLFGELMVAEFAVEIVGVSLHVNKAVTAKVEEDSLLFAFQFSLIGLTDDLCNGMGGLRSRVDSFCFGKSYTGFETFQLLQGFCFNDNVFEKLAAQYTGTMVTQTTSMNGSRLEIMSECVHG